MRGTAVQFGAGNIGRGFLAQLFHESGLEVVFVDVAPALVAAINARGAYDIEIVGPDPQRVAITGVRAIDGHDVERVAAEIAVAEIVATAVGANALSHIAPALAAGLDGRLRTDRPPLNVLLCENLIDAPERLRAAVLAQIPPAHRDEVAARTGFVHTVVSRMVPVQTSADPLTVRVEAYKRLPIEAAALVAPVDGLVGIEPVADFDAHVARKLYTHNAAHAALGYLGHLAGYTYGYEALRDPELHAPVEALLEETGAALIARYGFAPDEHRAHVEDLLIRFDNAALGDTCRRLGRDPIRKLAPGDRLVGAARLCEREQIPPRAVARTIAAALRYDDPDDAGAVELQRRLITHGRAATLRTVCGIVPDEPLAARIDEADRNLPTLNREGRER